MMPNDVAHYLCQMTLPAEEVQQVTPSKEPLGCGLFRTPSALFSSR